MKPMNKKNDLFIRYANNRITMKTLKQRIYFVSCNGGLSPEFEIEANMQQCRKNYYKWGHPWFDWLTCMEECEIHEGDPEYEMAKLYDEKKLLNKEAGKIKRAIYLEGIKRINHDKNRKTNKNNN